MSGNELLLIIPKSILIPIYQIEKIETNGLDLLIAYEGNNNYIFVCVVITRVDIYSLFFSDIHYLLFYTGTLESKISISDRDPRGNKSGCRASSMFREKHK